MSAEMAALVWAMLYTAQEQDGVPVEIVSDSWVGINLADAMFASANDDPITRFAAQLCVAISNTRRLGFRH
eukprot:1322533-Lingulodinium_polyedra.AAC.1